MLTAQCIVENTERYAEIASYLKGSRKVTFANRPEEGITRGAHHHRRFPLRRFCEGIRIAPLRSASAASLLVPEECRAHCPDPERLVCPNPGNVYAEPVITVYGTGAITLMVGMIITELEGISGSLTR